MKNIFLVLFLLFSTLTYAQKTTTFILMRHAERAAMGDDPVLHPEGEGRAAVLAMLFEKADISAIYSTDFNRTKMTVAPLAKIHGLDIQLYEWKNQKTLLKNILEENKGGTIIIVGHSNTTPYLANLLVGKKVFKTYLENDYGNLLIITTTKVGAGKLLHLRY